MLLFIYINTDKVVKMAVERAESLTDFIENRLQAMRYSFSKQEALKETALTDNAFRMAVSRLKKKSRLISPRQGFYVIVPPQYQRRGAPPASFFIDPMMEYLDEDYYVGILSAADIYGASHQAPQQFQVVVPRQIQEIQIERLHIVFVQNKHLDDIPVTKRNTETGQMKVSTPEATALDLIYYDDRAGHLDNVATVLDDLAESLDSETLLEVAKSYHSRASVQRLGYILEFLGYEETVRGLADWLEEQNPSRVPLSTYDDRSKGERNRTWEVIVNRELNPD
jgi:predicted transcriptional regulator of viral defense system